MQQIYRKTPIPKCDFNSNFVEITLRHGCSTVNLKHIFRGPFPRNTSGWLLLVFEDNKDQVYGQVFKKAFFKKTINVFKKKSSSGLLLFFLHFVEYGKISSSTVQYL